MRTFNAAREAAQGKHNVEIINYNYARVVLDPEELEHYKKEGVDLVKDFIDAIDKAKVNIKEDYGIDVSAEITGDKKNVILFSGVGELFEYIPDDFMGLLNLAETLKKNVDVEMKKEIAPPAVAKSALELWDDEQKKANTEQTVKNVNVGTKKEAKPAPAVEKPGKVTKKATEGENKEAKAAEDLEPNEAIKFLKEYMYKEHYGEVPDLVKRVMVKLEISKEEATKAVLEMIRVYPAIKQDGDMLYID